MTDALEILTKINWFLKPVTELILFLFTTKSGFIFLLVALFAYLILPVFDELKMRQIAYKAASGYGANRLSLLEKAYVAGKVILSRISKIVANAPVLLISLLLLMFITTISTGITSVDTFVKNNNHIKELKTVLKHLDKNYEVAEVEIIDYDFVKNETTLKIKYFDSFLSDFTQKSQEIKILGSDIYFDQIVVNFEYSQIEDGAKYNLTLPYRIYSNSVPAAQGIKLNITDTADIPLIYKRKDEDLYGISRNQFDEKLKEFTLYLTDEKVARQAGVRSAIGNAVHKRIRKGEKFSILIEQSGGIVIQSKSSF